MNILSNIISSSNTEDELVLVLDIGSSSVGGALFVMQKSRVPKMIFSVREPIVLLEEIDVDLLLSLTLKSLSVVIERIAKKGLGAPRSIFCVLTSPWYASQTRIIKYEKNTPFIFNSKLADSLIEQEVGLFEKEHLANYVHLGNKVLPIELKNMKMMLNGYTTAKPLGQSAKELEMTIFISMSSEQFLASVEGEVHKYYKTKAVKFSSFVMVAFAVARDMFESEDSFLLIDIGGEVTDIAMIKKEVLRESASYPAGKNYIIRGVSKALGCSLDEASSYVSLYKDNHTDAATLSKLEPVIAKLKAEWLKKFQESLANLSNDISIPATVIITVEQDYAEFFSNIIKSEQFNQYTLTESKFNVVFMGTQALHVAAEFDENAIRDPFTIMEAIYINRLLR